MNKVGAFFKKYWPEISAFCVTVAPTVLPAIQTVVANHPLLDHRIAWLVVILARIAPSAAFPRKA